MAEQINLFKQALRRLQAYLDAAPEQAWLELRPIVLTFIAQIEADPTQQTMLQFHLLRHLRLYPELSALVKEWLRDAQAPDPAYATRGSSPLTQAAELESTASVAFGLDAVEPAAPVVTRYTDIELPAQVQVAQRFPLIVGLTVAPSPDSADAQLLEAPLGAEIQCAITPGPNLVVLGDRIKPLTVGTGDSEPALFYLRATAVGDWQVTIDFWHEGQIRASSTHLIRAVDETVTMQTSHRAGPPLFGSPEKAPYPDLVIRITTLQNQLRYDLTFGDLSFQSFIGEPLRSDPEQYRYNLLQEIEALNRGTEGDEESVLERLTTIGQREYKTLWPVELQRAYRRFRNQIRTLQIISDEPWIPWELLKPYDDEEPAALIDDDFLALQFDFARWFTPALAPAASIVIDSLACIAPTDSGLPAAQQELALLQRLAGERQWTDYTPAVPDRATVRQLLRDQAPIRLWHFACHGNFDATTPGQSPLLLQGAAAAREDRTALSARNLTPVDAAGESAGRGGTRRAQLRPDDLVGPVQTRLKRDRPFVFLNACRVGSGGMELTGVGGWAKVLVADYGVGALLAPLWTINDTQAHEFAALFYQALQDDETTVAAATRTARKALQRRYPNDPIWLAYSLYAHPNARVGPAG